MAVNNSTMIQTHYTEPPFQQDMCIPSNTWRFTKDPWNGYLLVSIDKRDKYVTTFITSWGRIRSLVDPRDQYPVGIALPTGII